MNYKIILILLLSGSSIGVSAQDYSAIHGSDNFGSLGVYNNPSSIVSSPYKWDLTLLGIQYQTISNAVKGPNFPLNLSPTATFYAANGNYKRFADVNFNLHLLNGRYSLDRNHAFAFGLNVRGYVQALTSQINYTDSVRGPRSFLFLNEQNRTIDARVASSSWMEIYGSYALAIRDDEMSRLTAGATVKILKGLTGAYANVKNVGVESAQSGDNETVYKIIAGEARYGYSSNLGDGESISAGDVFSGARSGFALDLGVEYLIKTQAVESFSDEASINDYEWKIGVSLLDLGWNNFNYSNQSRAVSSLKEDVSSAILNQKFSKVQNITSFNDSLATIVDNFNSLSGNFKINNPARAVINVDRYVSGNIFVNAELSVNLVSDKGNKIAVTNSKLITVTPRWERRSLGIYIPVQVNRHGNFWMGGAVKAGPLLLGTHNLLNAFLKNKYLGGGAYLAIIIHPVDFIRDARNRQYECPKY